MLKGFFCGYSHDRAGVTTLLAALSDEERSVRFADEQVLRLCTVQIPNEPALLVIMWQILIFLTDKVGTVRRNQRKM